jgi:hypothetical protein
VSHDFLTDLIDRIVVAVHVAENPHKRESADCSPGYNDLERCYPRARGWHGPILLITKFLRSLSLALPRGILRGIDEEFIDT